MSIFEKAFEKAGKGDAKEQADQLFDSADDLLSIPASLGEDDVGEMLAEDPDAGLSGGEQRPVSGSGRQVTLDLEQIA